MAGSQEVPRTAAFTWSPGLRRPLIATGTKAGAVDEGFSNETKLELWNCGLSNDSHNRQLEPTAIIDTDSRFNDIAWTKKADLESRGIVAGALENGALDLWDADKLLAKASDALISRTIKHSGAIKALQFNAYRSDLLATVGAKGELFISDLHNVANPFRMGNSIARADDFDCLDWNKRSPHILVTGSSGGTMTVWDVKNKRESLTLNNMGRKAVSAVAWDPAKATRLATAIPSDTEPLISVWDLRNANAPEQVLKGHDRGVLSLSWCQQDGDFLLSCGKDNRTFCWNPQTGDCFGEFPVVTNWTFQTRWNPSNPAYLATASFDGKIVVHTIQNTRSDTGKDSSGHVQSADDDDFFNKAQSRPQNNTFSIAQAPKWLQRPCGASFGFGGKVVSFKSSGHDGHRRSLIRISGFAIDERVSSLTESFENALQNADFEEICKARIAEATRDDEKADWRVIKTLASENTRKELVDHLGFNGTERESEDQHTDAIIDGETAIAAAPVPPPPAQPQTNSSNRLSAFFDSGADGETFLAELAATKSAKTNNPFQVYSGSESVSDRKITHALLLGHFDKALDVCLQEKKLADAFMIAICGGPTCIEKAQKVYFGQKQDGPNYLRLLASIVTRNLWDLVHNADLKDWKDVMVTLCTYANVKDFPDLCEALGDRIENTSQFQGGDRESRRNATFCFLAGSKLEKVIAIWVADLAETEAAGLQDKTQGSSFSVHARSVQTFIEKTTVFRELTNYRDEDQNSNGTWKLSALYDIYIEYADIAAAHGQLQVAQRYLDLLPDHYAASDVVKDRIKLATRKISAIAPQQSASHTTTYRQNGLPNAVNTMQPQAPLLSTQHHEGASSIGTQKAPSPYTPAGAPFVGAVGYQQPQQANQQSSLPQLGMSLPSAYGSLYQRQPLAPPPRNVSPHNMAALKATSVSNWNDIPEGFAKTSTPRRGTPIANTISSYQSSQSQHPANYFAPPPKSAPVIGPPPKGLVGSYTSDISPPTNGPYQPQQHLGNVASSIGGHGLHQTSLPAPRQQAPIARGPSPYNAPPSSTPPSKRYTPTQPPMGTAPEHTNLTNNNTRPPPPSNPYAPQQHNSLLTKQSMPISSSPGIQSQLSTSPLGHPQAASSQQEIKPDISGSQRRVASKHREFIRNKREYLRVDALLAPGDRSHIPTNAKPIFTVLHADMQRVKARAPASFKAQVSDTEKRLSLLFDHLNNEELLKEDTISSLRDLTHALETKDFERAHAIHMDIVTNKADECGNWMVGHITILDFPHCTKANQFS